MPAVKVEGEGDGIRIAARDVLALNSLGSADPALLVVAPSRSAQSPFVIDAEEPRYRQRVEPIARVFPGLTVRENIILGGSNRERPTRAALEADA